MNQREKFINAIKDCSLTKIDADQMEIYAGMFTDDLAIEVVNELYSLKDKYDALEVELKTTTYKLEQAYKSNSTPKFNAKPPVAHGYQHTSIFALKNGEFWCAKMDAEDLHEFAKQLDKSKTGIGLSFVYEYMYPDIPSMLRSSFTFANTEKGFDFWNKMAKKYGDHI